jgi:hypothetical protein
MSESFTYKATFNSPKNKYLKYFCENEASEWTFKKFKKHFKQCKKEPKALYKKQLIAIKNHSKDIPSSVLREIERQIRSMENKEPKPVQVLNTMIKTGLLPIL